MRRLGLTITYETEYPDYETQPEDRSFMFGAINSQEDGHAVSIPRPVSPVQDTPNDAMDRDGEGGRGVGE